MQGFWDDHTKAQAVLRRRSGIESKVQLLEKAEAELGDVADYLELAAAEGDAEALADAAEQVDVLAEQVRQLELKRMLSGPADHNDAIVSINPGADNTDAKN